MRTLGVLLAALVIAACSQPGAAPVRTPKPSLSAPAASATPTTGQRYAVMVHTAGTGEPYYVQLVGSDGRGGPWARGITRTSKTLFISTPCPKGAICNDSESAPYSMPEVSVSRTRVYYLDGDTQIMGMDTAGTVSPIKNIGAPPNSQVMFSVSPDDSRVAVSIVTLATSRRALGSFDDRMYVEDLFDGSHHVDLYQSTRIAEWPIGWHGADLIAAVGTSNLATYDNPYGAVGYRVVDPGTGTVLSSLDCWRGLVVAAGTACSTGLCESTTICKPGTLETQAWNGVKAAFPLPPGPGQRVLVPYSYLSPLGDRMAVQLVTDPDAGTVETAAIQNGAVLYSTLTGVPDGWLDDDHLVVANETDGSIVDVASGLSVPMTALQRIPNQGTPRFIGTLPPSL